MTAYRDKLGPIPMENFDNDPPFVPSEQVEKVAGSVLDYLRENHPKPTDSNKSVVVERESEWDESEHPRDEGGRFTGGGSGGSSSDSGGGLTVDDFEKGGVKIHAKIAESPNKVKDFIEQWQSEIGMAPAAFKESFLGGVHSNMTVRHDFERDSDTGKIIKNDIKIGGLLLDENGNMVGEYTRILNMVDREAESAYLNVNPGLQGKGIAKEVLRGNIDTYKKLDIGVVKTFANIDVGAYAWAKYGYVPDESSWRRLQSDLEIEVSAMSGVGIPSKAADGLLELIYSSEPKALWAIADSPYGKELLTGTDISWYGTLDIDDKESMQRFDAYISSKK